MKLSLYGQESLRRSESLLVDSLTPQYGVGDCYPKACLGHSRWLDHLLESDHEDYFEVRHSVKYVQGWYLRRWKDQTVDGFAHGFLLNTYAAADSQPCIIDPLHHRYGFGRAKRIEADGSISAPAGAYEAFWLPVQEITFDQVDRIFEAINEDKIEGRWPLTANDNCPDLEDRLSYSIRMDAALKQLAA